LNIYIYILDISKSIVENFLNNSSTDNLVVIINYLLRKATVSAKHLGICKAVSEQGLLLHFNEIDAILTNEQVILHIYRKDAPPSLLPLLSHFNISNLGDELSGKY